MFVDHAKIYVSGGKGGNGCHSFHKDKYHRKGVPDGGDGGNGGNVIIECDASLSTLLDFRYRQHHRADNGKHGGSNNKYGRNGSDSVLKVPPGTIIIDRDTGLVVRDLTSPGESVIAAKGGKGGIGNNKREAATEGDPGEDKVLILELKLLADAGIVGFPNAGKSTLVSALSRSRTKIAGYPFTTKEPRLGVVRYDDDSFVVADMPGLIEGAHHGRGLGDRFLRHIERTQVIVHLVDIAPFDGTDPFDNFVKLEEELKSYSKKLYNKPRIIAAGKIDLLADDRFLRSFTERLGRPVYPLSSVTGKGLKEFIAGLYGSIKKVREDEKSEKDNRKTGYTGIDGQFEQDR
jgi:GTP-binding protein